MKQLYKPALGIFILVIEERIKTLTLTNSKIKL